ncbi:type II secretion system protein GspM [Afipia sp. GAS231]|uniref:type II secretion system protein GspM n=1 Tax=Afipia sp. GAS231 TaxID=1882747 RepID=UPI00087A595A|nr:type II secretion system protein GspM [Afipia sp. GAS231]SDN38949.1 general secretion pathway protein M [Afipia sp. GAS231]
MNQAATLRKLLSRPLVAVTSYLGVMILFLCVIGSSLSDVLGQQADVAASTDVLAQFQGRGSVAARGQATDIAAPSGSPLLEGATVTIAGAALLQRVSAAVTKLGGNVLSSQVELQGTQSNIGFVTIIASCEIDQPGLQRLLYDLEAGMPFLFVDQLVVQSAASSAGSGEGRLRILLAISGQWQGAR